MRQLWNLAWGLWESPEVYAQVVYKQEVLVPKQLSSDELLKSPTEGTTNNLEEDEKVVHTFLNLSRHPSYPTTAPSSGLLPSGCARIPMAGAYRQVYDRATVLNQRYCSFVASDETGYNPPPRHLILTGMAGMGKHPFFHS